MADDGSEKVEVVIGEDGVPRPKVTKSKTTARDAAANAVAGAAMVGPVRRCMKAVYLRTMAMFAGRARKKDAKYRKR